MDGDAALGTSVQQAPPSRVLADNSGNPVLPQTAAEGPPCFAVGRWSCRRTVRDHPACSEPLLRRPRPGRVARPLSWSPSTTPAGSAA